MHGPANPAYLKGLLFCGLLRVASYCTPGGVRVVSTAPSYRPNDHHELGVELDLGQPGNEPEQGAADDEHDPIRHREVAGALKPATATSSPAIRSSAWPIPRVYPSAGRTGSDLFRKWPFVQPLRGLLEPHVWRAPTVEGWRTSPCRPRRLRLPRACPRVFPSRFGHNSPHWTSLSGVIGRSRTRIPLAW